MRGVPLCTQCGLTCEILHKCQTIVTPEGTYYYHDTHATDCYETAVAARREEVRRAIAYEGL